nr:unnamed protein product [Spirometra erinaceieuropaei]
MGVTSTVDGEVERVANGKASYERDPAVPTFVLNADVLDILSGGELFIEHPLEYSPLVLLQNDELLYAFQPARQSAIAEMVFVYST